MRLLKVILISSAPLLLAAAPVYAGHSYNHPKPPEVVEDEVITRVPPNAPNAPDVVKGKQITRVPPNAPEPPGITTLGKVTEVPAPDVLGTITDGPEAEASVLPFTGAELTGITLLGVTAIGVGMVFSRARRRS